VLTDPAAPTGVTADIGAHWLRAGRRQLQLDLPESSRTPARVAPLPEAPGRGVLAAMLAVSLDDIGDPSDSGAFLAAIHEALQGTDAPLTPPVVAGRRLHLAFADPLAAAIAAGRIGRAAGAETVRIAGHYGVAQRVDSPFGGSALLGAATGVAPDLLGSVPAGAIHVSETFATALHSRPDITAGETTYVGDLSTADGAVALYALSLRDR